MRARVLAAVAVTAIAAPVPARADELDDAHRLAADLDYDHALALVEGALARGGNPPARVAALHLFAGQLAAGLDRPDAAEAHYAAALALRPDAALPDGASPKLAVPFTAARARNLPPLRVHAAIAGGAAQLAVDADPLGLVAGIAVETAAGATRTNRAGTRVALAAGDQPLRAAALDAAGNELWRGALDEAPHRSVWGRWELWAGVAGVAAIAGGGFGWRERVAQDDWNAIAASTNTHDYSELTAAASRGRAYAIAADVGFGVAAAAAITAIVVGVTHRHAPSIAVIPRSDGVAIAAPF